MVFADRVDAGAQLAVRLEPFRGRDAVVLGLPRGGVPVAAEVAEALDLPLDVIVVRKLGVPFQPELAMGAIGEDGARFLNRALIERGGSPPPTSNRSSAGNGKPSTPGWRACGAVSRGSTCATRWRSSSTTASRRAPLPGSPAGWPASSVRRGSCWLSRSWLPRRRASFPRDPRRTRSCPSRRPGPSAPWAPITGTSPQRPTTRSATCSKRRVRVRLQQRGQWGQWGQWILTRTRMSSFLPGP